MSKKALHQVVFSLLARSATPLSLTEISLNLADEVSQRTLRRWLSEWVMQGEMTRLGTGRATRYQIVERVDEVGSVLPFSLTFLADLDDDLKTGLLNQIRDLWTHTSTALEGNSLSLGDTHFVLEQGLTISGKPIKDHQEVIGHARAIDLLYQSLARPLSEEIIFSLHKAVQTENVTDIYKPNGAWKNQPNGTYAINPDGEQVFIEYALPMHVPVLMAEVICALNTIEPKQVDLKNAHIYYAKVHMGIVHIHPFRDGNGRIARLLANIPLLRAGLPPIVISQEERRTYIQLLTNYQLETGQINEGTGVWPDLSRLNAFNHFCAINYANTSELATKALGIQERRN